MDKVQRHAARFVKNDYRRTSVSGLVRDLGWQSYRMSYRTRPPQGAGSASGVKRTDNVQTLTHPCHEVSVVLI